MLYMKNKEGKQTSFSSIKFITNLSTINKANNF